MRNVLLLAVSVQLVSGCVPARMDHLTRAADPGLSGNSLGYQSVTGGTRQFRPAEPKGWEELNRRVGPKQ